jgi:diguanylate cyclase (GGDEF)-like protein/PAS domain S-box-containing protein
MFQRLRAFAQTTTYLGVAVIALIWCGVIYLAHEEHARAYEDGVRQGSNLARIFEGYISRVMGGADSTLLALRELYKRDPKHFDITSPIGHNQFQDVVVGYGLVDRDGLLKFTSVPSAQSPESVKDREHFRFQAVADNDELYVSKPAFGRITGRLLFFLSRRLTTSEGSFNGVMVATIDILQLQEFYNAIDIGRGGVISLVGFDGIIRARSGGDPSTQSFVGKSVGQTQALSRFQQSPTGCYWNFENKAQQLDSVRRLICYHVVEGVPLFAVVGLAEEDIFRQSMSTAHKYCLIACVATICVFAAIWLGALRQKKLSATMAALNRSNLSLEQVNLWFDTALESMAHGLSMFDKDLRLIFCNERYSKMYGLTREQTKPGTDVRSILEARVATGNSPQDAAAYIEDRLTQISVATPSYGENELKDGRTIAVSNQPTQDGGWVAIHQDITERKQAEKQIAYMARHDALTGLANRTVLSERMEAALARLQRHGEPFAVLMLDLDLFKTINDSLGHPVGDELLKVVAQRLSMCVGDTDTVARLGGDEFAVLATAMGDQRDAAIKTASRLLEAVSAPCEIDGHHIDIGTSVGIALAPEHGDEVSQLMKSADLALYKAKADGRDRYRFFEETMGVEARTRRILQSELRNALNHDEFELHYHPIVDIKTMEMAGVEALVRWQHPQRGLIAPGDFIPLAEETGVINLIGEWVLCKACRDAVAWPSHVKVSVNLSPVQFRKASPIEAFRKALGESGLSPARLEVEITESVLMHGNEHNIEALHQLRRLGISVVLDDFGTGYSSLSYLRMFPFDKIKIDRSFVQEVSKNTESASIITAVASLGRSLQIATVAEGVETDEQLILVRAAGCTHVQGFLFGRPCRASEVTFQPFTRTKPNAV